MSAKAFAVVAATAGLWWLGGPLPAPGSPKDGPPPPDERAQLAVQLKLNTLEIARLIEVYQQELHRERLLRENVGGVQQDTPAWVTYKDSLTRAQKSLEQTKAKLVELEAENERTRRRLGRDGGLAAESEETLRAILRRLTSIEKRLEQIEPGR